MWVTANGILILSIFLEHINYCYLKLLNFTSRPTDSEFLDEESYSAFLASTVGYSDTGLPQAMFRKSLSPLLMTPCSKLHVPHILFMLFSWAFPLKVWVHLNKTSGPFLGEGIPVRTGGVSPGASDSSRVCHETKPCFQTLVELLGCLTFLATCPPVRRPWEGSPFWSFPFTPLMSREAPA